MLRKLRTLVEMVEVVVLVENIFLLALDFKEIISYLDRRLMNRFFNNKCVNTKTKEMSRSESSSKYRFNQLAGTHGLVNWLTSPCQLTTNNGETND